MAANDEPLKDVEDVLKEFGPDQDDNVKSSNDTQKPKSELNPMSSSPAAPLVAARPALAYIDAAFPGAGSFLAPSEVSCPGTIKVAVRGVPVRGRGGRALAGHSPPATWKKCCAASKRGYVGCCPAGAALQGAA